MENIGWIIAFVGTGILLVAIGVWRMLRDKESESTLQEKNNSSQGLTALGSTFVVLGAALSATTDRLIGYSFIGAGVLLAVINAIWSKRVARKRKSESAGG